MIVLVGKPKLNLIEILVSKALIGLHINHGELALVNDVLREYSKTKKNRKNLETFVEYTT